ncbi:MAG: DUF86 domain-containing protein [Thaumarchaeota archaeon]|nr:DUF86 domain-containing protein [Nitrososphaerota archaeon]
MKRVVKDHVNDIIDSMNKAMKFIEGMSYEQFIRDDKTVFAVVRALEIIGEAVKKIPEEIRVKYPEIPWKGMAGMRNKVIHEYFGVNLKYVWETVGKRIPELKPMFEKLRET